MFVSVVVVLVAIVFVLLQRAYHAPWGRMMRAIRDNPVAAEAMGKDVSHDAGPPYWPPSFFTLQDNLLTNSALTTAYYNSNSDTTGYFNYEVTVSYDTAPPGGCPTENCFELTYSNASGLLYQTVNASQGQGYTAAVLVYSATSGQEFQFRVDEFDNNDVYLDSLYSPYIPVTAAGWNLYTHYFESANADALPVERRHQPD